MDSLLPRELKLIKNIFFITEGKLKSVITFSLQRYVADARGSGAIESECTTS